MQNNIKKGELRWTHIWYDGHKYVLECIANQIKSQNESN